MERQRIPPRPDWPARVEAVGFDWHTLDGAPYWTEDACYRFTAGEIDQLEAASLELHAMCLAAVERVIADGLYPRLGIAEAFIPYIETTWRRGDPTVLGRFDLAFDGAGPPKLLEYNADTPTALVEAAVVQWYWLRDINPNADQFNSIHETLVEAWGEVAARLAPGALVHFAAVSEAREDWGTLDYARDACQQAGLTTARLDVADIGWNGRRFTDLAERPIQVLVKLYPWEWLVQESFAPFILTDTTAFLEPAWKMILSNKGILPLLWEMFPGHPNLLPAFDRPEPLAGRYVRKPRLGREGANVTLVTPEGRAATGGSYGDGAAIYQAVAPLPVFDGWHPVIGSWIIGGHAAGIGVREDRSPITHNLSRFAPHYF
jgi:glutathionylspermidine synthase